MISVDHALARILALTTPIDTEIVPLLQAAGRVMAQPAVATRAQPPFAASAMDGYAIQSNDAVIGATLEVTGTAAAGHGFSGQVKAGQAVRIFTGAPVPSGADGVVIQEDVQRTDDKITFSPSLGSTDHVRPAGGDFDVGDQLVAPRLLGPADVALLAAMNVPNVTVRKCPVVALMATGDELVMPGETPGPDQIIASNSFGLAAMVVSAGGHPRLLPIARDNRQSLETAFDLAQGADLVVTIGGASVGDHDLVGKVAQNLGLDQSFYKVAMRPGKPLMAGIMGGSLMLGLPGNPVSSMVCGTVFMQPAIRALLGLAQVQAPKKTSRLLEPLPVNGAREHYMRAIVNSDGIRAHDRQDSSLLRVLADANALLVRAPHDPARDVGDTVDYIPL